MYRDFLPKHAIGAEVGVWLAKNALELIRETKPKELHLVDHWIKDPIYQRAMEALKLAQNTHIHKSKSIDAASLFEDHYFDWIYIDAKHSNALEDFHVWLPKIKPGGILSGHDFFGKYPEVKQAVHAVLDKGICQLIAFSQENARSFAMQVRNASREEIDTIQKKTLGVSL